MAVALLGGGTKPALGGRAIGGNLVTAAMKRTERKHRADMSLGGRLFEQGKPAGHVLRAAPAVQHHLRERDLGILHPGLARAGEPTPGLLEIGRHAAPLHEHPAIDILRLSHTLGRLAQPMSGLLLVALHADTLGEA